MSENKSGWKILAKWIFIRLPIIFGIVGLLMIGALKMVERYPNPLREGFEEFLSKQSGANATIGTLEKIKFFPNIDIHIKNLTMHNRKNAAIIDLEVESAEVGAPFWSMLLNGARLNKMSIINLRAEKDMVVPLALTLDSVEVIDKDGPDQYGSFLVANGAYGGKPMDIEVEIEKKSKGYKIPKEIPFSLSVGKYSLNASLVKGFSGVYLESAVFSRRNKSALAKDYGLVKSGKYNKDNPLSCLLYYADTRECDKYLEEEDSP